MTKNKTEKMEIVWDFVGLTIERVIANAKSAGKIGVGVGENGVARMIEKGHDTSDIGDWGLFEGFFCYGIIAAALMRGELGAWVKEQNND